MRESHFNSYMDSFIQDRPVVHGAAEGAMAPPDIGRSVNPISTRRAEAHHIITGAPGFSHLPTALQNHVREATSGPQPTVQV